MGCKLLNPVEPEHFAGVERKGDLRLGRHVRALENFHELRSGEIVLIGVPEDRGVEINHGSPGAALGPRAFRETFYKLSTGASNELANLKLWDAGDVICCENNVATHASLREITKDVIASGAIPIIIGGSHDNTYGGVSGVVHTGKKPTLINIDAHLDLRTPEADGRVGSGTPFYRLIHDKVISGDQLVEFGFQPQSNSKEHIDYAQENKVSLFSISDCRQPSATKNFAQIINKCVQAKIPLAISLDMDCIAAGFAPGVSAPSPLGFNVNEIKECLQLAGQSGVVCYFDIMELNPLLDVSNITSRLAANLLWIFLCEQMAGPII